MRQLALLVAAADSKSLRAAAEAVHVSQPAATKMLREAESTLGVQVFHRGRRGLVATPAGESIIGYARITVADLRRLHEALGEIQSGASGHIAIGSVLAPEPVQIARAIARFTAARPGVTLSLQVDTSDALVRRLLAAELDAVIARQMTRRESPELEFRELAQERLVVVAGPGTTFGAKRWTAGELNAFSWVLLPEGTPVRRALESAFLQRKVSPPQSIVETNSMFTVVTLLQNSNMISAVSERTAEHFASKGELVILQSNLHFQLEPYGIFRRRARPVTPATEAFLEVVREEMKRA